MRAKDLSGLQIGKLVVQERVPKPAHYKSGSAWWRCICICGKDVCRDARSLTVALERGRMSSCGCALSEAKAKGGAANGIDVTGQTFGALTVMKRIEKPSGATQRSIYYTCQCECGKNTVAHAGELRSGKRHHCGCQTTSRHRLAGDEAARRSLLRIYRHAASDRNHVFDLTEEQFFVLASSVCAYCGVPPSKVQVIERRASADSTFPYNGVDRKDNHVGYTEDNCVSCCEQCNKAKRHLSVAEFYEWTERVHVFRSRS